MADLTEMVADVETSDAAYTITRDGEPACVLVGYNRWRELTTALDEFVREETS